VDARNAVQAHHGERGEVEGDGWLFVGKRGEQPKSSGIRYLVERYACNARLEEVTPHTLRHTLGKNLVDAGAPLDRVASLLGHESVDTTRIYATLP
jgi:integrase/recombinase XerC